MHQVATRVWNEIGETVPLKTDWAKQVFPLPDEMMQTALADEESRLTEAGFDPMVSAAYLLAMPLLQERDAIAQFKANHPEMSGVLPEIGAVDEAVLLASQEFPLDDSQKRQLQMLLQRPPR